MNVVNHSRLKIILLLVTFFLVWQAFRFFPWLQIAKQSVKDYNLNSPLVTPVFVTVFYEALCPDSKNFIVRHLLPTINKASRLLNITLVPYGKAVTEETNEGRISFSCQHGPVECTANKIHACSISKIANPLLQVKYISCMISDNIIPELIGEKCAQEMLIDWKPIIQCANSQKGNILLKNYGKMTNSLRPKIDFVPTVLLNSKRNNQAAILKDFFKEVCSTLNNTPNECSSFI